MSTSEHRDLLLAALEHARRRTERAAPGSPEWDAASGEVEALDRELAALDGRPSAPGASGQRDTSVMHVGPVALADGRIVHGTLAGREPLTEALRREVAALVGDAGGHAEFWRRLELLAADRGWVVERGEASGISTFYMWQEPPG